MSKRGQHHDGFTLLEMVIVVVLVAFMATVAIPKLTSFFRVSLNGTAREMASVIRETYHSAVLTKKTHRLVYDLEKNSYWVEATDEDTLLESKASLDRKERNKSLFAKEEKRESPYRIAKTILSKPKELPLGVTFEDVYSERSKDPITKGHAYTYFFPHGLTEQTLIHIEDESEHHNTLVISATLGRTDVFERNIPANEIFEKR